MSAAKAITRTAIAAGLIKTRSPQAPKYFKIILIVAAIVLFIAFVYNLGRRKGGKILDVDAEFIDPGFDYDNFVDQLNDKIAGYSVVTDFGHYGLLELMDKMYTGMNADEWRLIYNKYNQKYGNLAKKPPKTLVSDIKEEWFFGTGKTRWLDRAEAWLT